MKIQFATKQMTVPERVYSHAEHRINELDPFFRARRRPLWSLALRTAKPW